MRWRRDGQGPSGDASNRTAPRETQYLFSSGNGDPFTIQVEREGAEFEFPPNEKVLLSFRGGPPLQHLEVVHYPNFLTVWRPGDVEVWATLEDGSTSQIAGFATAPAPWLDS